MENYKYLYYNILYLDYCKKRKFIKHFSQKFIIYLISFDVKSNKTPVKTIIKANVGQGIAI